MTEDYDDLQADLAAARDEVKQAQARLESAQQWLAELESQRPPYRPGQRVTFKATQAILVVEECKKVFNEWAVKGHYERADWFGDKDVVVMANSISRVLSSPEDDDDLPF